MAMTYESIRIDRNESYATLWLNRSPLNILNIPMMEEMIGAVREIAADKQVRLLLVRGTGPCFSAGMDVGDHLPDKVRDMFEKMHALMLVIVELNIPTISIIHGSALGGGLELAAITDFTYAVTGTKMGQPEIKLGVFPPVAVTYFPTLIGMRHAYDLILTGRNIDAQEALRMGLINGIFDDAELEQDIEKVMAALLALSGAAIAATKKTLRKSIVDLFDRLSEAEEIYLQELMKTEDSVEGLNAFLQKRQPKWKHR
jgi:cyclohexa-1,5-dienecarbonyl-CoA hydratase